MPIAEFRIGDCPKCAGHTFVVFADVGIAARVKLKGKCYKCGHSADIT